MTIKELERFIQETLAYPYFSTLYDMDIWKDDFKKLKKDLEILKILEEADNFFIGVSKLEDDGAGVGIVELRFVTTTQEKYNLLKEWLENGNRNK